MTGILASLKLHFITIPLHRLKWSLSIEAKLLRQNGKLKDERNKPSVFIFSTHKCASTFLNSLIKNLAEGEHKKHIDVETYLATRPNLRDELYANESFTNTLMQNKGHYFGVFRYPFAKLPAQTDQKIVLVLRDPRDILTSQYFSIAFSHPVLTSKFLKKRENALAKGIDEHVLEMTPRFLRTYNDYLEKFGNRSDVLLIRYEDLVMDFEIVLLKLLDFIDYSEKEKALNYWKKNDPFVIEKEDSKKHKRKMLPGDHKEKLKPDTIHELNRRFAHVLACLGHK